MTHTGGTQMAPIKAPSPHHAAPGPMEKLQFRGLVSIVFLWFFAAAVIGRITPSGCESTTGKRESCFQEAKRSAYSVIPYAFMRI